jgi:spore coat protein U-like protein
MSPFKVSFAWSLTVITLYCFNLSAACNLSLSGNSRYNFSKSGAEGSLDIKVRRSRKSQSCNYCITFTQGQAGTYDPRAMTNGRGSSEYNIYKTNSTGVPSMKDYPDADQASEYIDGRFRRDVGGKTRTHTYYVKTTGSSIYNIKSAGSHVDTVTAKLYEECDSPGATLEDTMEIDFTHKVDEITFIHLSDNPVFQDPPVTQKALDFGELVQGAQKTVHAVILYNAGYDLEMSSKNGETLKGGGQLGTVEYDVTVGGVQKDLTNGTVSVSSAGGISPNAPSGLSIPIVFTIGDPGNNFPGTYTDTITLTLKSIE